MKKYVVSAKSTLFYEIEIMANNEDEAMDKAEKIDGAEWTEICGDSDWNPLHAEEVKE